MYFCMFFFAKLESPIVFTSRNPRHFLLTLGHEDCWLWLEEFESFESHLELVFSKLSTLEVWFWQTVVVLYSSQPPSKLVYFTRRDDDEARFLSLGLPWIFAIMKFGTFPHRLSYKLFWFWHHLKSIFWRFRWSSKYEASFLDRKEEGLKQARKSRANFMHTFIL